MNSRLLAAVLCLMAMPGTAAAAATTQLTFTTLDIPGGGDTYLRAVSGGRILGAKDGMPDHLWHSFVYDGGQWLPVQAPGATETDAHGIDGNRIVGDYTDASGTHHFLFDGSTWQTLNVPGTPRGIDGNLIVGDGGYVYNLATSSMTWLVTPGPSPMAADVSGNRIVGTFEGNATINGFLYTGTAWKVLPGIYDYMRRYASGVSGSRVVGYDTYYGESPGAWVYDGQAYSTLKPPGVVSYSIYAHGIDANTVVGYYTSSDRGSDYHMHGFVATLTPEPATAVLCLVALAVARRSRHRLL
jgi:hypothetical protein